MTMEDFRDNLLKYLFVEKKFEEAKERSKIPMYPDFEAIEKLKLEVNRDIVRKSLI